MRRERTTSQAPEPSPRRAAGRPPPPARTAILALQRTAGNRAVARALLQRALSAAERDDLMTRATALGNRLEGIVESIPAVLRIPEVQRQVWGGTEHPAQDRIRAVHQDAANRAGAVDHGPLDATLVEVLADVDRLDRYVAGHAATLAEIARTYAAFTTAGGVRESGLAEQDPKLRLVARDFFRLRARSTDLATLLRSSQGAVVPSNDDMKRLRAANAQAAMDLLAKLINARLVDVKDHKAFYESPFDLEQDHFGASWGLIPRAATGAMQWLRDWEFHVHAAATRIAGALTGFAIHRAHVKPSADPYALGVSIQITDAALLARVAQDAGPKFLRWAGTPKGDQTLKRKKRG